VDNQIAEIATSSSSAQR